MYSSPSSRDLAYPNRGRSEHEATVLFLSFLYLFPLFSPDLSQRVFPVDSKSNTILLQCARNTWREFKCLEDINFKRFGWITAAQCMSLARLSCDVTFSPRWGVKALLNRSECSLNTC